MDIPADSDYDNQPEIEPVITDLMPLEKQDPKLRAHYIDLPELPYALFFLNVNLRYVITFLYTDIKKCNPSSKVFMLLRSIPSSGEHWRQRLTNTY